MPQLLRASGSVPLRQAHAAELLGAAHAAQAEERRERTAAFNALQARVGALDDGYHSAVLPASNA